MPETPPPPGSATATRQGHRDKPVRVVLIVSTTLAIIALTGVWWLV